MTDERKRRDGDKSRQELLDELYYLRDVAGERGQRAQELEQRAYDLEQRLATATATLRELIQSRSWRLTRPLRSLVHRSEHEAFGRRLATLLASDGSPASTEQAASAPLRHANSSAPYVERIDGTPCLFVDVSELVLRQGVTGVQRVAREITLALLAEPPQGYAVEPVYAAPGEPYRYARSFVNNLTGNPRPSATDAPMEIRSGDVFLGLDHAMDAVIEHGEELAAMKAAGVKFWFVLNDTLPLSRSEWFPPEVSAKFRQWFQTISRIGDGIACISKATEDDVREWLGRLQIPHEQWPALAWFHLGADGTARTAGAPDIMPELAAMTTRLRAMPSFLVVGTLEPRKGHAQTLETFNRLWEDGEEAALVLAGRPGWMTDVIQRRIRHHDEFNQRLFWFMDASDELLDTLYASCTALLAPSEGEGFGLPLVEAARHRLPILCRDLPVFREVAGNHATYFEGLDAESLAQAVRDWLAEQRHGGTPGTVDMPRLSWSQSAARLLGIILERGAVAAAADYSSGATKT